MELRGGQTALGRFQAFPEIRGLPLQISGKSCSNNLRVLIEGLGGGGRTIVENHKLLEGTPGTSHFILFTPHTENPRPGEARSYFHGDRPADSRPSLECWSLGCKFSAF